MEFLAQGKSRHQSAVFNDEPKLDGSDFSNKDISRTDDIVEQYDHTLISEFELDGHVVYEIESVPHEDAAVVWGKEVLFIRDDNVMVEQRFYDQDMRLLKICRRWSLRRWAEEQLQQDNAC